MLTIKNTQTLVFVDLHEFADFGYSFRACDYTPGVAQNGL
jgi:hypothetical protein